MMVAAIAVLMLHAWCAFGWQLSAIAYGTASQDGTQKSQKVFVNIPTEVGASEPEEIGANDWRHGCNLANVE
jgi:hypothetical protein